MKALPLANRPVLQQGILFGLGLGIVILLLGLLNGLIGANAISNIISYLIVFGTYVFVSYRVSAITGKIRFGMFAAALTSFIAYFITEAVAFTIIATNIAAFRAQQVNALKGSKDPQQTAQLAQLAKMTNSALLSNIVLQIFVEIILPGMLIALLFGLAGGFIARRRQRVVQEAEPELVVSSEKEA